MNYPIIKSTSKRPYQICKCCVIDTTDEGITFDSNGVCMRCNEYKERIEPAWNHGRGHEKELQELIAFCAAQWPPVRLPVATRRCQWPGLISHFSFNHNDVVFRHPLEQRVG